jgi:hypothetical protein
MNNQNLKMMEKRSKSVQKKTSGTSSKAVYHMTMGGRKLKKYSSISEASVATGVDPSSISKVTRGIRNSAGGFFWKTV